ncbi:hypothetical protein [Hyphomonas sp. UBA3988]|uniref:hypothetical protein n=1 Tax=Hyphomonas sp. UBA3988 TaxID=1946628 RepID=UPI0025C6C9A3|nr:hypothetical protein [Hyphomonas sp. UBA3988]
MVHDRSADPVYEFCVHRFWVIHMTGHGLNRCASKEFRPIGTLTKFIRQVVHALGPVFFKGFDLQCDQARQTGKVRAQNLGGLNGVQVDAAHGLAQE